MESGKRVFSFFFIMDHGPWLTTDFFLLLLVVVLVGVGHKVPFATHTFVQKRS